MTIKVFAYIALILMLTFIIVVNFGSSKTKYGCTGSFNDKSLKSTELFIVLEEWGVYLWC